MAMASNPSKRRSSSITLHYDISSALVAVGFLPPKKLRRMPHLFCRVLELPLDSESPVQIEESLHRFTFATSLPGLVPENVRAEIIEIVPGVTKVVIGGADGLRAILDALQIPLWRYRLPPSSLPEAASATYDDGMLIVTVPKASNANPGGAGLEGAPLQSDAGYHGIATELRTEPDETCLSGAPASGRDLGSGDMEAGGEVMVEDVCADIHAEASSDGLEKDTAIGHPVARGEPETSAEQGHAISEVTSIYVERSGDEEGTERSISVQ